MSTLFNGFVSFLGFPEGSQQDSLSAMLSAMVAKEVESNLAANTVSSSYLLTLGSNYSAVH